ncbi:MAG: tryptophan-rich sensory protein [Opitutales bacterium]|nr:tryptophan-rich sensory protein [Opitutales bacterium]MCH8540197.1 tryptophan-rich sensory protein [Opitutales bacterium]
MISAKNALSLSLFFLLVAATAYSGTQFQPGEWYGTLEKPSWNPPNWVFGPVWTVLYVMIAVAGWLTWKARPSLRQPALLLWIGQLVLNGLWSAVFFGLQMPLAALLVVIALLALIVAFVLTTPSRGARFLFLPYGLWVAFATALNAAIVWLN